MSLKIAEARARTARPGELIGRFREHMVEHGLQVGGPLAESEVRFPGGMALLRLAADGIALRIEAEDLDRLADARNVVAGHLDSFSPDEPLGIVWTGDGAVTGEARPHNFRALTVTALRDITPRMRRLRLSGPDIGRYDAESIHVKVLIPADRRNPAWPTVSPSGQPSFAEGALMRRTYTIRRIDAAAGWMDLDFVLHGDEGPGSAFAVHAREGDPVGIMGPGGGSVPSGGWTIAAGDETALPAIARALETMPADTQGTALLEVADAGEIQDLVHPAGVTLRWLPRDGAAYGERLVATVRETAWPAGVPVTAWAACENGAARAIREEWGEARGLPRSAFRSVAYWRQGGDGE